MKINVAPLLATLDGDFKNLEKQRLVVGVLDNRKRAAEGDSKQPLKSKNYRDPNGGSFTVMSRKAKAGSRAKNPKLKDVAAWIDRRRRGQMFAQFNIKAAHNADVARVAESFAEGFAQGLRDPARIKRLENAGRALVRNPILRSRYGSNKASTAKEKGFNHYGMDTGTLFNNIKAEFYLS